MGSLLATTNPAIAAPPDTARFQVAGAQAVIDIPGGTQLAAVSSSRQMATTPDGDYIVAAVNKVVRVSRDGTVEPFASGTTFSFAYGAAVEPDGDVLISDFAGGTITRFAPDGTSPVTVAANLPGPAGLALQGDDIIVALARDASVVSIAPDGARTTVLAGLSSPTNVAVDDAGDVLVSDESGGKVLRVTEPGASSTVVAEGLSNPTGVAFDSDGGIYVAEFGNAEVSYVAEDGAPVEVFASGIASPVGLTPFNFGSAPDDPAIPQAITFTSTAPADATVGDTYTPAATGGGSGNPVTFSIAGSAAEVCSIDVGTGEVTFVGPGTCTIAADQAGGTVGGEEYADAEQVTQDVTVTVPELFITGQVSSELPANEAGWYRTPATVTYTCGGGTAPLVCPEPVARTNTQPGFKIARKVTDADGQETKVRTPLQVDTTVPRIKLTRAGTGPYPRDARPITCAGIDTNSGIDGDCTVTYGRIVQSPQGGATRRWTATVTDVAGNATTVSRAFRVEDKAPQRDLLSSIG